MFAETRALIVLDDLALAEALRRGLAARAFVAATARPGADALQAIAQAQFDVVLTALPATRDRSWLEQLRPPHPELPAAFLTGAPDAACGPAAAPKLAAYLPFDIEADVLARVLRRLVRRRGQQAELAGLAGEITRVNAADDTAEASTDLRQTLEALAALLAGYCPPPIRITDPHRDAPEAGQDAWRGSVLEAVAALERRKDGVRSRTWGAVRLRLKTLLAEIEPPATSQPRPSFFGRLRLFG